MTPTDSLLSQTRRHFFKQCGVGLGALALTDLWRRDDFAAPQADALPNPLAPKQGMFPAKAKRVIFLFMAGAPSQFELFTHKPELQKLHGQPIPDSFLAGKRSSFATR